jgi:hypothetical protein
MSAYDNLTQGDKVLLQQVAANPAFMYILEKQKEDLDQQILNFWALENESDEHYRRRNELLHIQRRHVIEQLTFYQDLLK